MEARELNHRLGHLDFNAIHFFVEGRQCESSMDGNFAPLGYCLENAVAEPVGDRSQLQLIKTVTKPNLL